MDMSLYALCKTYADNLVAGGGAIQGISVVDLEINNENHLICHLSNATTIDAGLIDTIIGPPGDKGDPGAGVSIGGTTGQVLIKKSDVDYDTKWVDAGSEIGDMTKSVYDPTAKNADAFNMDNMSDGTNYVKTENNFTDIEKTKLGNIAENANVSGVNTGDETNETILTKIGYTPEDVTNKGQALGYCALDGGGKVPLANLPATILKYIGTWDATTNTPTLTNNDLTKACTVYQVSVAGTQFGLSFSLGDWLIYNENGVIEKSDNADDVLSVNGKTGTIVLTTADIADSNNKRYVTEVQLTVLLNTSGVNSGDETTTSIGTLINGATAKTTPVDADMFALMDSAASNIIKKLSWSNLKSTLKTYLDGLYATISHTHTLNKITDVTATAAELNYSGGLIANIQSQFGYSTGNIAPVYSGTKPYAVGDLVLYNYELYECIVAIGNPEATFVPAHWTKVKLSERLYDLYNTNTTAYTGSLNDLPAGLTWCSAAAINVPIANSGYCTTIFGISGYKSQTYTTNTTREVYVRAMAGSVWGTWAKLPYIEDAYTKKNITTFSGGNVRTLTPGITWCDNTCTNLPVTDDWGLMTVTAGDSTKTILSLEFRGITKNTVYTCTYVNSVWSPWTCVSSDRIISTSVTNGTYCSNIKSNLEQAGRMAHVSLDILLDRTAKGSDFPANYTICTLPVGYRPLTTFWLPCIHIGYSGSGQVGYLQIDSSGVVTTGSIYTANCYVIADTTFMTR